MFRVSIKRIIIPQMTSSSLPLHVRGIRGIGSPTEMFYQKFRPFVSSQLDDYLKRYWAVVFTVGSRALENTQMRQYLSWYCTRGKVVELDHHIFAHQLRRSIIAISGTSDLPVLFVKEKYVGTLREVQELERRRLLKDVLQFGFVWQTGGIAPGTEMAEGAEGDGQSFRTTRHALPSAFNDTELFRARYRGPPVARPVVELPTFHPFKKPGE